MITFEWKEYTCKNCGKKFFPKKKNPSQVPQYCSQKCARKKAARVSFFN